MTLVDINRYLLLLPCKYFALSEKVLTKPMHPFSLICPTFFRRDQVTSVDTSRSPLDFTDDSHCFLSDLYILFLSYSMHSSWLGCIFSITIMSRRLGTCWRSKRKSDRLCHKLKPRYLLVWHSLIYYSQCDSKFSPFGSWRSTTQPQLFCHCQFTLQLYCRCRRIQWSSSMFRKQECGRFACRLFRISIQTGNLSQHGPDIVKMIFCYLLEDTPFPAPHGTIAHFHPQ